MKGKEKKWEEIERRKENTGSALSIQYLVQRLLQCAVLRLCFATRRGRAHRDLETRLVGKCCRLLTLASVIAPLNLGLPIPIPIATRSRGLCFSLPYVYRTLSYPTLHYPTPPYLTLPYRTLPYPTLPSPTLPYPTLPYLTLPYLTLPYLTLP